MSLLCLGIVFSIVLYSRYNKVSPCFLFCVVTPCYVVLCAVPMLPPPSRPSVTGTENFVSSFGVTVRFVALIRGVPKMVLSARFRLSIVQKWRFSKKKKSRISRKIWIFSKLYSYVGASLQPRNTYVSAIPLRVPRHRLHTHNTRYSSRACAYPNTVHKTTCADHELTI